jgi:hypothetical protein
LKNSGSSSAITTPRPAPRQPDGVIQPRDSADSRRQSFALTGRSVDLDLRTHAVRRDIADIRLAEHVFAPHYAVPMIRLVARTATLRAGSSAWGVAQPHGLVGYVEIEALDLPHDKAAAA